MSSPKLTLYTVATPNGHKVSIALEILGLPYECYHISLTKMEQKEPWFLKINPNGRAPALIDHSNGDFAVFESGAILLYLSDHYDPEHRLLPADPKLKSEAIQWLMWQMGGLGPMMGQATYFHRYAPEKIPYGIKRYQDETRRLLSVLESHLESKRFIVGNQITVADISSLPWVRASGWAGIESSYYPNICAWIDMLESHPKFISGLDVPEKDKIKEMISDPKVAKEKTKEISAWVRKG